MNVSATLFASLLLAVSQAAPQGTSERLGNFVLTPIYDVRVPARESGALTALKARKGQLVEAGQILGQVDDSDAQIRKLIASNELKAAEAQAASDADLQAAVKTVEVAEAEWEGSEEIKSYSKDAISEFTVRRDKLTYERSKFNADTARVEYEVNQITRAMRMAQLQAVENEIKRRQVEAPLTGVIADRYHNEGEWAQAGEPIYRLVHMDRLRVEGMLNAADLTPAEIEMHPDITIFVGTPKTAENPRGEVEIKARIDFVSQVVDHSGEFLISAEFDNPRTVSGQTVQWAVRPGLDAEARLDDGLMKLLYERRMQRRSGTARGSVEMERIMSAREGR